MTPTASRNAPRRSGLGMKEKVGRMALSSLPTRVPAKPVSTFGPDSLASRRISNDGLGPMTIEAVIWDFGGVFTTSPFEAFNRYEAEKGLPRDLIRRVNSTNPDANAWALFERNEIDAKGFDDLFLAESTALGHPVAGRDVLPLLSGGLRPRMVAALKTCKAHFKVGCITNNVVSEHSPGQAEGQQIGRASCRE